MASGHESGIMHNFLSQMLGCDWYVHHRIEINDEDRLINDIVRC